MVIRDRADRFYAMDARCPHEGGPLDQGDIEELGNRVLIMCPWHSFEFDVSTGVSASTGLKQTTYATRVVDNCLYVNTPTQLALKRPSLQQPLNNSDQSTTAAAQLSPSNNSDDMRSLCAWAVRILNTADPNEKVNKTSKILFLKNTYR